jgi:hypothetical protein
MSGPIAGAVVVVVAGGRVEVAGGIVLVVTGGSDAASVLAAEVQAEASSTTAMRTRRIRMQSVSVVPGDT